MKNILSNCFIKESKIKPEVLGGKLEITIRQLTAGEGLELEDIRRDPSSAQDDVVFYAVKCAMVEPTFFTDDELKKLNTTGRNLIYEIYGELPLIGKTKKEREEYLQRLEDLAKKIEENKEKESLSEDEKEKK